MIYLVVALNYVRIVNPYVYKHAAHFNDPPTHWACATPRAVETNAGNWSIVRDGKLTVPLQDFADAMERRTVRMA